MNVNEGPLLHGGRRAHRGRARRSPEPEIRRLIRVKPGDTFSRSRLQASAKDISDRLGADGYAFANVNAVPEIDRDEEHGRVHVLHRPGPPRLRAQDQHQRQPEDARRGDPPRGAPARGRVVRRHRASSGRRCACAAWAISRRTSTSRRRRCRARPTRSTSRSRVTEKIDRQPARRRRLLERGRRRVQRLGLAAEHLRLGQRAGALASTRARSTARYALTLHRAVLDGGRRVAHARALPARTSTRPGSSIAQYSSTTLGGAIGFGVPVTETDTINFGVPRRAHRPDAVRRQPADLLSTSSRSSATHEQLHRARPAGRVTPATTSSILRAAVCRARWSEIGLPLGDLAYYKLQYIHQWFWPVYGDFVLMLRGDIGYGDGYGGKPLPFFKAFYAGGVGLGARLRVELARSAGHLRQHARRQAQDRRQRRAVLSDPEGRQVGARQRVLRRRARST